MGHTEPLVKTRAKPSDQPVPHPRANEFQTRRHHMHRSHRSGRTRVLTALTLTLSIVAVGAFIGWINTWVALQKEEQDRFELAATVRDKSQELELANRRADTLSAELAELVKSRIPGLRALVYDHTVSIGDRYVRNVSFTRTGTGDDRDHEYRLVLENRSSQVVRPALEILLFDRIGLQVGSIRLSHNAASSDKALDLLGTGETRAYTGVVPVMQDREPLFFMISIDRAAEL